jgi:hypothetical protein
LSFVVSIEAQMLASIRSGLDQHNAQCPMTPKAILLNPGNHELFGWEELWGIPVLPDERVAPRHFRVDCDGSASNIEEEIAEEIAVRTPARTPMIVPVGPREDEPTAVA